MKDTLSVGLAQISPVFLNREKTLQKVVKYIRMAGEQGCDLVTFGEALAPGYPFWVERSNGAVFESPRQKKLFARYAEEAVDIAAGHLQTVCQAAKEAQTAVILGCIEKASDRSGHSLHASLVYINRSGEIASVHRKLVPTYEERLVWAPGDGNGLRVHALEKFKVGGLNCWENWMPLPRAALYAQGEDLHVAIWPGSERNTVDISRFIAKESRSYVISVCGMLQYADLPADIPDRDQIFSPNDAPYGDGGSCIAAPDGTWLLEPQTGKEGLFVAELDHSKVREERQNFDPSGHYSRPDVTRLHINRSRQNILNIEED